ncbi:MAG: hypothetical protein IPO67_17680 [Deltaproteobacteria bacterium]|nr:hypothetical protein [Deltaproteobacteria bacterium]
MELPMPSSSGGRGLAQLDEGVVSQGGGWDFSPQPFVLNVQDPLGAVRAGIVSCDAQSVIADSIHDIDGRAAVADWRSQKVWEIVP